MLLSHQCTKRARKVIKILFVLLNLCSVGHYHCPEFTIVSDSIIVDIGSFAVKYYVKGSVGICRAKVKTFTNERTEDGKPDIYFIMRTERQNITLFTGKPILR